MNPFVTAAVAEGLVLASRSPRRVDILRGLGLSFVVDPPHHAMEDEIAHGDVFALPEARARAKCAEVAARHGDRLVLAADTEVIFEGEVLGKPADDAQGAAFLRRLSGRAHTVVTGVALFRRRDGVDLSGAERTRVTFRALSEEAIARYVSTGEGRDKAGSYAAQGLGAGLIRSIDGCFYNVVGLPVALLLDLLAEVKTP